ncbi:MAG: rod shape-determining protein MreC [Deltaproteobacteria bacterium]|jgi:rod shape-determining protein MreC|nr:rod shape-determining protein MreC [Deltaproteobacteria bacterium]
MGQRRWKTTLPAILLLGCLAVISLGVWNSGRRETAPSALALEAKGPLAAATAGFARAVETFWRRYFNLVGARVENERLRAIVNRQSKLINDYREDRLENQRLKTLLAFQNQSPFQFLTAKVLAWDPGPFFQSFIIGAGSSDGVPLEAPVVTDQGIVGRVAELSPNYAKVLLVTDLSSGVDAFVERNRVNALIVGAGPGKLSLDYARKAEDVRVGDLLVSSGLDGIFPGGLSLGTVTFVDKMSMGFFMRAEVSPSVDIAVLEEVSVILNPPSPVDWTAFAPNVKGIYEKKGNRR